MRESIDKLQLVCDSVQENKWLSQLEATQWLSHIRSVLKVHISCFHYFLLKMTGAIFEEKQ